ncbi:hypothetical protein T01_14757, partial [Trichinella spiralis]
LLMAFNIILDLEGQISLSHRERNQCAQSFISNLRKPAFTATCAVSVFYANW